jgi:hypothetical protein
MNFLDLFSIVEQFAAEEMKEPCDCDNYHFCHKPHHTKLMGSEI